MRYPVWMDEKLKAVCLERGVYYERDGIRVFACRPTNDALKFLEIEDGDEAMTRDIWGGDNLYILQWYGEGVRGVRKALRDLKQYIRGEGVLAGQRHGRSKRWTKQFIEKGVRNG